MKRMLCGILVLLAVLVVAPQVLATAGVIECQGVGICWGTEGDDTMVGDNITNDIRGLGGEDALNGFGGGDFLRGHSGGDQAAGGQGADIVWGGSGNDYLIGGCFGPSCPAGQNEIYGNEGADTIGLDNGVGGELAHGGDGSDTAYIDGGDDTRQVEKCIINGTQRPCP